jgi:putative phage-type endonuclease
MTAVVQGTPAWHDVRRESVSSTDLSAILGLSPYRSEADLADEKLNGDRRESTLPMRIGLALEPVIKDEYERQTGLRLRRVRTLARHPRIPWAVASPDYAVVGRHKLVEAKWTTSRRWNDGLPQDVESQVQWCLGVVGWREADVAALIGGRELSIFHVEYDDSVFEGLVEIAVDFRKRLAAGGPFSHSLESLKRAYPADDGSELVAGGLVLEAVTTLLDVRGRRKALEADEERLEILIKESMGEASVLVGPGFRVTWKRTKDREEVDWRSVADGLLRQLPETERTALVGIATTVRPGFRPFRVVVEGGSE